MSKWKYVEGRIRCKNREGMEQILGKQVFKEDPWKHYRNPYPSLCGSEGDAQFSIYENDLLIDGSLRDADSIPEDREVIIEDFKEIIKLTDGEGYIEITYDSEGTIVVDYYDGKYDVRIFPQADGWHKYYERFY